jgi:uncharacterized protein YkwD
MRRLLLLVIGLCLPAAPALGADACFVVLECEAPAPSTTPSTVPPGPTTTVAPAPEPEPDPAGRLLELANAERSAAGVAPLAPQPDVVSIAAAWSAAMADRGELAHNDAYFTPSVRDRIGAGLLGENVAYAGDIGTAHATLMASPHHRDNLLDARFTVVGMAAVQRDGLWWVTQDFAQVAPAPARPVAAASAPGAAPVRAGSLAAAAPAVAPTLDHVDLDRLVAAVQRSWDSATARIRWRWSPLVTSNG